MKFKGNPKSLEHQFLAAANIIRKHVRHFILYTPKQLAIDILLDLSSATRDGSISEEQVFHFSNLSRAEILCEIAQDAQDALLANNKKYEVKETGFFSVDFDRQLTLRKNVNRLTTELLCEDYSIKSRWLRDKREINHDDILYARFLRENGLSNRPGAEITEKDDPMDLQTALAILGFFEKPKTIEQATDEAARRLFEEDGVNPGIIDRIIRNAFGSLYNSVPNAHERVIERARVIFREERRDRDES